MQRILENPTREALSRAHEENLCELLRSLAGWPRISVQRDERFVRSVADVAFPIFNSVLCPRLDGEDPKRNLEEVLAPYRARGLPCMWWIDASATPRDLASLLEGRGFLRAAAGDAMALDLWRPTAPPPRIGGFRIERVWGRETLAAWAIPFAEGSGFPQFAVRAWLEGMRALGFGPGSAADHYVGLLDGHPVASASLFRGGGVAALTNLAVARRARGRGAGAALAHAALRDARAEGFRAAIADASAIGGALLRRLGFQTLFERVRYVGWA